MRFFEQWVAMAMEIYEYENENETESSCNWSKFHALSYCSKIGELSIADEHTIVRFFRKRIPCHCLDKKDKDTKRRSEVHSQRLIFVIIQAVVSLRIRLHVVKCCIALSAG